MASQRHSQGMVADTLSLKFHNFARISVCIPSCAEQQKIVATFQILDNEIQLLQSQLAALQQQKRGLMQKLLSGQVRVPLPGEGTDSTAAKSNTEGES